jgi:putative transcriptional regulator
MGFRYGGSFHNHQFHPITNFDLYDRTNCIRGRRQTKNRVGRDSLRHGRTVASIGEELCGNGISLIALSAPAMAQQAASAADEAVSDPADIVVTASHTSANVSQPVFARHLGTSSSTVEKWETGAKMPSAMALKLLSLVEKHGLEILA